MAYLPHENRAVTAQVTVRSGDQSFSAQVDMTQAAPREGSLIKLGELNLSYGDSGTVELQVDGGGGVVHADAIQLVPADGK